jgi:hypothetical protein
MADELRKPSHTIRLLLSMLTGLAIGYAMSGGPRNALDRWDQAAPLTYSVSGALVGLAIELIRRFLDGPTYAKKP